MSLQTAPLQHLRALEQQANQYLLAQRSSVQTHIDDAVLAVRAGKQWLLPMQAVAAVELPGSVAKVPHVPHWFYGIGNVAGRVAPVLGLAELMQAEATTTSASTLCRRWLVLHTPTRPWILAVEDVVGLRQADTGTICSVEPVKSKGAAEGNMGIDQGWVDRGIEYADGIWWHLDIPAMHRSDIVSGARWWQM